MIHGIRRAEIQGDTVLHHPILLENLIEHFQRSATVTHEIFGNNLEPVYDRFFLKNMFVVRDTKADADSVLRKGIEPIRWHKK